MKAVEIKKGIYWVGGIDWDLRNFHGYITPSGSTYNAYLIVDEKIVLVDTVKHYLYDEMVERIKDVIDPEKIDYIVSNHVEMDHSGCLPRMKEIAPNAVILTSQNGEKGLKKHYGEDLKVQVVDIEAPLNIGKRNLNFVFIPMVHWPDSMVTYIPEDKLLLPNDAFGQHIASSERFDDEIGWGIAREEAAKYYANIVLPYGRQVNKALDAVSSLEIDMIAPSHGIIWRKHIADIIDEYKKWANNVCDEKAVVIYDTMWHSTEQMAHAIKSAMEDMAIPVKMINLRITDNSQAMTAILEAKYIFVGSPTLNNNMLPTVAAFLIYLKGLAPKNRKGLAFGSYGWGGQSVKQVSEELTSAEIEVLDSIKIEYIPTQADIDMIKNRVKEVVK